MNEASATQLGKVLIREAMPTDAVPFRTLRLSALENNPIAFTADYQKNASQPPKYWEDMLTMQPDESTIFLAVNEADLIGMSGVARSNSPKTRHGAWIWGVYVNPEWRGLHIAEELIKCCLAWARARKMVIAKLGVIMPNASAIRCYERCGFKTYGTEPCVMLYEGKYYDEYLMYCPLEDL